jgi:IS1 family transposase
MAQALALMAEGVDVSALERVMGIGEGTLRAWLMRAIMHAEKLHNSIFMELVFQHIQLDDVFGYAKRRANVRHKVHEVWLWVAMEATTKVIPVMKLGPRTLDMAMGVVHELCESMPSGCTPIFSSDGLKLYFYALTAHFGYWALGEGEKLTTGLKALGLSGKINTAFIERLNLAIRQGVSFLVRRTWGAAQFTPELELHMEWWRAYYHFSRYHESLRIQFSEPVPRKGKQLPCRYGGRTPAMAAGLASRRWSVLELLSYPLSG